MKLTQMQILRNSLFDELARLKSGDTTPEESNAVVKVSNSIISTFNTELKAVNTLMEAEERGYNQKQIQMFDDVDFEPAEIKAITKRVDYE